MGGGQAGDEGAQQFALAGAGGADQQAVRAHSALRGLLEVQLDDLAVLGDADRHLEPGVLGQPGTPLGRDVEGAYVTDAEHGGQVEVGFQGPVDQVDAAAGTHRGEGPGQLLGLDGAEPVGPAADVLGAAGEAHLAGADREPQHLGSAGHRAGEVEQHHSAYPGAQQP